ncbi:hypothetical protein EBZ38_05295 [bacterium]|nr:hypothetical protein [bacterium]
MSEDNVSNCSNSSFMDTSDGDPVSEFLDDHMETIIDLYDHYKETFCYCPEFLGKLQSVCLTDLYLGILGITEAIKYPEPKKSFIQEYERELALSYAPANAFIKNTYNKYIPYDTWKSFCCWMTI